MNETERILLEGVVAGSTVLIGVLLAESLARARSRRERIEAWIAELALTLPRYLTHFTGRPDFPDPSAPGFPNLSESVTAALSGIRFNARFPIRRRRQIQEEVEELSAKVTAVFLRYGRGDATSLEEIINISVKDLRHVALGKRFDPLEDRFETYLKDGIPIPGVDQDQ